MPLSALALHGVGQEEAGAALDVFTEQLTRDVGMTTFHGGTRVKISGSAEIPFEELEPWSLTTASLGFEAVTPEHAGGVVEGLRLRGWLLWPEPQSFRLQGEAGIGDLDMLFRLAVKGGRNAAGTLIQGNPQLQWRPNVTPYDWAAPPAGFAGTVGANTADHGIVRGPLPTAHFADELALRGQESCIVEGLAIDVVFGVARSTC